MGAELHTLAKFITPSMQVWWSKRGYYLFTVGIAGVAINTIASLLLVTASGGTLGILMRMLLGLRVILQPVVLACIGFGAVMSAHAAIAGYLRFSVDHGFSPSHINTRFYFILALSKALPFFWLYLAYSLSRSFFIESIRAGSSIDFQGVVRLVSLSVDDTILFTLTAMWLIAALIAIQRVSWPAYVFAGLLYLVPMFNPALLYSFTDNGHLGGFGVLGYGLDTDILREVGWFAGVVVTSLGVWAAAHRKRGTAEFAAGIMAITLVLFQLWNFEFLGLDPYSPGLGPAISMSIAQIALFLFQLPMECDFSSTHCVFYWFGSLYKEFSVPVWLSFVPVMINFGWLVLQYLLITQVLLHVRPCEARRCELHVQY